MASERDPDRDPDTEEELDIVIVDMEDLEGGHRVSELMRSTVVNDADERVGTIDDFIIGGDDRVVFAILQVGGFLGLGGKLVAVPFDALVISEEDGKRRILLPGATREELENAPEFNYES
ncbi:MAG TPA: PRC-barrel domain-containing protein [Stellaceae bacterium]